jgi:hypothetical protein
MKIFVSATSADLRSCREAVKDVLLQADIQPTTQEVLRADQQNLPAFLDTLVQSCDCVICLIGGVFGAASTELPERSYTMREYDCAKKLGKPVFVFLTTEEFCSGQEFKQSERERSWQQEHRKAVMEERYCRSFSSEAELEKEVGVSIVSILKACGRTPVHYCHLPTPPPYFVGRADEISQLTGSMARRTPGVIAVTGMPGQGKSTFVHHVVESCQQRMAFPFHGGFWCTADVCGFTFDMFLDAALTWITDGAFEKAEMPQTGQRVQRLLEQLQKRPLLVVIDALERWLRGWEESEPDEFENGDRVAAAAGLDDFLTQAAALANGTHLIVISRAMPDALEDVDKSLVPIRDPTDYDPGLQGLGPEDAAAMLRSCGIEANDEELTRIAAGFGFHPLALRVFGGFVKKRYGGRLARVRPAEKWDRKRTLVKLLDDVHSRLPGGESSRQFLAAACCSIEDVTLDAIAAIQFSNNASSGDSDVRDIASSRPAPSQSAMVTPFIIVLIRVPSQTMWTSFQTSWSSA